jgi:hypothetical protein
MTTFELKKSKNPSSEVFCSVSTCMVNLEEINRKIFSE